MFSCGWLPPLAEMPAGFICELGVGAYTLAAPVAHRFPAAPGALGAALEPIAGWLCAGIS